MPNVELDPANLAKCPAADAMPVCKTHVVVVHKRAVEIDIVIGVGDPVCRPCRLKALWTEANHITMVHEDLDGTGLVQVLRRTAPQMKINVMRLAGA